MNFPIRITAVCFSQIRLSNKFFTDQDSSTYLVPSTEAGRIVLFWLWQIIENSGTRSKQLLAEKIMILERSAIIR